MVCCHGNRFRYCPSIESKIIRFGDKPHQIWLEPEGIHVHTCTAYMLHTYDYLKNCSFSLSLSLGLESTTVYPSGLSCTLPPDIQQKMVNTIGGLENATITHPG